MELAVNVLSWTTVVLGAQECVDYSAIHFPDEPKYFLLLFSANLWCLSLATFVILEDGSWIHYSHQKMIRFDPTDLR